MFTPDTEVIENRILDYHPTGSNYICNPPVEDTDIDYICLVNKLDDAYSDYKGEDWVHNVGGTYAEGQRGKFYSFKKFYDNKIINLILVEDMDVFDKWVLATETAKKLNLLKKEDRITLFSVVIDGELPEESEAQQPYDNSTSVVYTTDLELEPIYTTTSSGAAYSIGGNHYFWSNNDGR